MRLKSVNPLLPPKPGVVAKEQQHEGEGHRLRDDREVHALDARAEREEAEHEREQPRHQHHQQRRIPEMIGETPVPGVGLPVEEHHEVRQHALVDAVEPDRAHQVHAERVAAQGKEQPVPERQDAGVAPDQVHRQCHDRVAHELADQRHAEVRHVEQAARGNHEIQQRARLHRSAASAAAIPPQPDRPEQRRREIAHASANRPLSANMPCGRFWMKMMMNTSTMILASTAPDMPSRNLLTMPRPIAA